LREEVLSDRALNRATLARQLLLERASSGVVDTIEHLVGLQAQEPLDPYTALWSRLSAFDPHELGDLLVRRDVVRIVTLRGTIHLHSAADALALRPLVQPVLDAELARHGEHADAIRAADTRPVVAFARRLLSNGALSGRELRAAIAERFPEVDATALAYACRNLIPLVQVPPRGVWGQTSQVRTATLESWVGGEVASRPSLDAAILRYLAAFGPATPGDASAWSRLTGLREVFERLRPRLRAFRDERGRELFDLPDAPRPDAAVTAPVRFLPEYDNVLLSHADRIRFGVAEGRRLYDPQGIGQGAVLIDGMLRGVWRLERESGTLDVRSGRVPKRAEASVVAEGRRLLRFLRGPGGDVRVTIP
jgi:hypothetical protein